ncbi:MAG: hypothetical protein KME25_33310 [Symplocastrum torsivum CPER-KK1]|uniref:Uncharacterized protein n=1 Tax=Symplocastrum torsivum CPER-KK1 TaxID=450513 RepID=A0A951PUQ4_9CYAN|nr:hypothetical protein [Symplocastrum torsivum CPER-KK1]
MVFAILFDILIGKPFPLLWLTEPLLKRSPYLQNESAIEHQHHLLNVFKIIRVIQAIAAGLQPAHSLDFHPSQPVLVEKI